MIFKCLEYEISESRVLFCSENEIPKIRKWLSNVLNKSFRNSENHFRNIRKTYSSRIRRRNSENKKPICYISDIIFSVSEINNHILRKLKTNILFSEVPKVSFGFKENIFFFFFNEILSGPKFGKCVRI